MRWFKHYSDNYRGRSVEELYSEMGHTGISCYYLLTELCTEKLESRSLESFKEDGCKLSFSLRFVRRNLRISQGKLEVFLRFGAGLGLFSYEIDDKDIHIEYPILLELLDSDSKRSRSRREQDADKSRLEEDKEEERDKYNNGQTDVRPRVFHKELLEKFEEAYRHFPRKVKKAEGFKRLKIQIKTIEEADFFTIAVQNYAKHCADNGTDPKYIQHFSTFVGDAKTKPWTDWLDPETGTTTIQPEKTLTFSERMALKQKQQEAV